MPLATIHLLALSSDTSIPDFVQALSKSSFRHLVLARVVRWIISPEHLSTDPLLTTSWDLLIISLSSERLPATVLSDRKWIEKHWKITAGVPGALVNDFATKNAQLLDPSAEQVPALTGSLDEPLVAQSSQGLELSKELLAWSQSTSSSSSSSASSSSASSSSASSSSGRYDHNQRYARRHLPHGAVSMLNLLAFHPGKAAHESYTTYGKAFAESIGARRGGKAKIVGRVVPPNQDGASHVKRDANTNATANVNATVDDGVEDAAGWDEIALAHYPSITHFVDMLASKDYQAVNHASRLPALRDTCILCTTELDPELTIVTDKARL